jgi:hypothetical protein
MVVRKGLEGKVSSLGRVNGGLECRKDFVFEAVWSGRHYATKQVRPIFVEEPNEIVVVTVYVYYF